MPAVISSSFTSAHPLGVPFTQLSPPIVQQPKLISETFTSLRPSARYSISISPILPNRQNFTRFAQDRHTFEPPFAIPAKTGYICDRNVGSTSDLSRLQ